MLDLIFANKDLITLDPNEIDNFNIVIYNDAYKIICGKEKWHPTTRQSADHSMVYILSTLLRKAMETGPDLLNNVTSTDDLWKKLMLDPYDYSPDAISNPVTRSDELPSTVAITIGTSEIDLSA